MVQYVPIDSLREHVDFAIITVRPDEYEAVLEAFAPTQETRGMRRYAIGSLTGENNSQYTVAFVRTPHQGFASAQQTADAVITDLAPRWILLVGIGGVVPDHEFTLGDVVLGIRFSDFSVRAALQGKPDEFDLRGSYAHPEIEDLLAHLPALRPQLMGWSKQIDAELPPVPLTDDLFYGDDAWKEKVHKSLRHHFDAAKARPRLFWPGTIGTSNTLVKDADLAGFLSKSSRSLAGFEMEAGGVLMAARRAEREYPVLVIRGISDVVGYKRSPLWTAFACKSAAAFTHALLKTGAILPPRLAATAEPSTAKTLSSVQRVIPSGFSLRERYPVRSAGQLLRLPLRNRLALIGSDLIVLDTGKEIANLKSTTGTVWNVASSGDGRFIAGGITLVIYGASRIALNLSPETGGEVMVFANGVMGFLGVIVQVIAAAAWAYLAADGVGHMLSNAQDKPPIILNVLCWVIAAGTTY